MQPNKKYGKIQNLFLLCLLLTGLGRMPSILSQDNTTLDSPVSVSALFSTADVLPMKLMYSNKSMKNGTNDSTYINSILSYKDGDGSWRELEVGLRARGNFRRKKCYYTPIKIKIKKSVARETLFEGNKKLKLVLPCFNQKASNDYILKEYMAYKFYEALAPYHFKTRLVAIEHSDITSRKTKSNQLYGILIEDIKNVAHRHQGHVFKRFMNPMTHDTFTSVQNDLFQYMIGNTDYSTVYQHNQKQLFADKRIVPIPYDFDMSGFVNTNYAVVSKVQNELLTIEKVTDRMYRGFQRDENVFAAVRASFLEKKNVLYTIIQDHESLFVTKRECTTARDFLSSFYSILENEQEFQREIVAMARPMPQKKQ
ncbi:MAG: hypothetical protein HKN31_01895 [Pricia sp.]|nr:hypothetical protein [Pricia sp.]